MISSGGSLGSLPLLICLIIFCICLRAFSSWVSGTPPTVAGALKAADDD